MLDLRKSLCSLIHSQVVKWCYLNGNQKQITQHFYSYIYLYKNTKLKKKKKKKKVSIGKQFRSNPISFISISNASVAYISGQYRFQVKNNININLLIKYKMEMVTEEEEICASLCEEEDLIFKD